MWKGSPALEAILVICRDMQWSISHLNFKNKKNQSKVFLALNFIEARISRGPATDIPPDMRLRRSLASMMTANKQTCIYSYSYRCEPGYPSSWAADSWLKWREDD